MGTTVRSALLPLPAGGDSSGLRQDEAVFVKKKKQQYWEIM